MDPNLNTIIHANRFAIQHGSIHKACTQAEDYLVYILGFNEKVIQKELDEFVNHVKTIRRRSRGKKEGQAQAQGQQRTEAPTCS